METSPELFLPILEWDIPYLINQKLSEINLEKYQPLLLLIKEIIIATSIISILILFKSHRESLATNRVNNFLKLRQQFFLIHEELTEKANIIFFDNQKTKKPKDYYRLAHSSREAIKKYWIHTFNEWYIMHIIYKKDGPKLWQNFYALAIGSSLANSYLREGFIDILKSRHSFGAYKSPFKQSILRIAKAMTTQKNQKSFKINYEKNIEINNFITQLEKIELAQLTI